MRKVLLEMKQGEPKGEGAPMDIDASTSKGTEERKDGRGFRAPVVNLEDSDDEAQPMSPSSPSFEAGLREMQATLAGRAEARSQESEVKSQEGEQSGGVEVERGESSEPGVERTEQGPSTSGVAEEAERGGDTGRRREGGSLSEEERTRQDEQYAQDVNTLENVFDKAGAPDRPGEVRIIGFL